MDISKIIEYTGYFLAGIVSYLLYKFKKDAKSYDIKKTLKMTNAQYNVYKKIVELVDENIIRSYILEFHNGDKYISKINELKMSCTYEFVRTGYEGTNNLVKEKPVTLITKLLHGLLNKEVEDISGLTIISCDNCVNYKKCLKCVYRIDVEELDYNYMRSLFECRGIEIAYLTVLSCEDNIYGLLIVEIKPGIDSSIYDENDMARKIHGTANTVSSIMSEL